MCSCGGSPPPPPASSTPPCNPCETQTFPPREVSHPVTEAISGTPASAPGWSGTYNWDSKFTLSAGRNPCAVKATVKIKIGTGTITEAQKTAWKNAIESKWSGKAKLVCPDPSCAAACPGGYPISVEVLFVDSGEHYVVNANNSPASGNRSVTPDMGTWGVNDTVDITHEFGHMLGNTEEYFTINGHQYTAPDDPTRTPGGTVMNNPAGDPSLANYGVICQEAGTAMGLTCTSQAA